MLLIVPNVAAFNAWNATLNGVYALPRPGTMNYSEGFVHPSSGQVIFAATPDIAGQYLVGTTTTAQSIYFWLYGTEPPL